MLTNKSNSGFTLVEMAMVLMIVGLLLGGLIPTISSQMEQQLASETRKQMDEIQQALIGYAIVNGRLPCPAEASLATGLSNAGEEATTGNTCACKTSSGSDKTVADNSAIPCTDSTVTGVLPWVTLGIKETDAWGRRYTYRVTRHFADQIANTYFWGCGSPEPTAASFALCSPGVPDVDSADSGGTPVADNVPAIFLSHGKNGAGAYTQQGTQLSASSNADEEENSDNDKDFVSHPPTPAFDDLLVWIPPSILINRMVMAGKLP
jgi:prepilin-type N-terminal cleavage/methylation domain-containing protein